MGLFTCFLAPFQGDAGPQGPDGPQGPPGLIGEKGKMVSYTGFAVRASKSAYLKQCVWQVDSRTFAICTALHSHNVSLKYVLLCRETKVPRERRVKKDIQVLMDLLEIRYVL